MRLSFRIGRHVKRSERAWLSFFVEPVDRKDLQSDRVQLLLRELSGLRGEGDEDFVAGEGRSGCHGHPRGNVLDVLFILPVLAFVLRDGNGQSIPGTVAILKLGVLWIVNVIPDQEQVWRVGESFQKRSGSR